MNMGGLSEPGTGDTSLDGEPSLELVLEPSGELIDGGKNSSKMYTNKYTVQM